ncbi:hypothetical protein G6F64_014387 [Rhizopus arrhizus]|uniref:Tryptophan synthase beta chain-like PALP domain-containing protein n=1 Tax=Rhizopus oryzae TaxID=64495 RepID=A0A9P7BJM5_RHIOR|nr:hypothetical protein G6F64_014387 [Rhizopus arrhizus]
MPHGAPAPKIAGVAHWGATVRQHGNSYDEAYAFAVELAQRHGYRFLSAFDDADVIAGQGTVGMEILRQHPGPIDAIFVAIGGGGLGDLAIRYGYQRFQSDVMAAVVIVLIVLVQAMQSLGDRFVRRMSHR